MNQFSLMVMGQLNQIGIIIPVIVICFMGALILGLGVLMRLAEARTLSQFAKQSLVFAVPLSVFLSVIGMVFVTENFNNYKPGMCFNKKVTITPKRDKDTIQKDLQNKQEAYKIAQSIKADNIHSLEYDLKTVQNELDSFHEPVHLDLPVVVLKQNNGNLYYFQNTNEVEFDFRIGTSYYPVTCSPELKKIVNHYQKTGQILTVKN